MENDSRTESLRIHLHYRVSRADEWIRHELSAADYYEPEDEGWTWDSTPRYSHACEYLTEPRDQLEQTYLRIYDGQGILRCTIREVFWNEGRNRLIEQDDDDGELLILELHTGDSNQHAHVIRYDRTLPDKSIVEHLFQSEGGGDSIAITSKTIPDL